MGKNVVVCCDGTANQFAKNNTNVVKLYSTLVSDSAHQVIFYHPGVGTWEAPGALTDIARRLTILAGQAFGYGLESDIAAAYTFIMHNYRKADGDRLFLFGFSRGAYTVRAVASLLHMCGILRDGHETSIPYAIRLMNSVGQGKETSAEDFRMVDLFRSTFSTSAASIYFTGVWDTVSSVGWVNHPLHVPYSASNPDIEIGRHAVSIDERRSFFRQNLWRPGADAASAGPKDLKQVWFAGVHCDVGGGYQEEQSGLSKIALRWMLREAEAKGLLVDPARKERALHAGQGPDPNGPMHDELTKPLWRLVEYLPKRHYDYSTGRSEWRANRARRRTVPDGAWIHESAFQRANYAPPQPPGYQVEPD
jgi:uncharacterized protein (DUF2235 family)